MLWRSGVYFCCKLTMMSCAAPGTGSHSSHTNLHFFIENKDGTIRIDPKFDSTDMSAQAQASASVPSGASAVASTWTSAGSAFTTAKAMSAPVMSSDNYQVRPCHPPRAQGTRNAALKKLPVAAAEGRATALADSGAAPLAHPSCRSAQPPRRTRSSRCEAPEPQQR